MHFVVCSRNDSGKEALSLILIDGVTVSLYHGVRSPGALIQQIPRYRASEKSSIAVVDGALYYRSANICKSGCEAIVLSTESLLEIGYIQRDGKGTFPTADNRHCRFGRSLHGDDDGVDLEDKDGADLDKDEDPETARIEAVRERMRSLQAQIMRIESDGFGDEDELDALEMQYEELFSC